MRTPAQQVASRVNGARSLHLLAVAQDAVEETCSTQSFPDDLGCLAHACGALAGNNPRPRNILRRSLARIQALRRIEAQKRFDQTAPEEHTSGQPPTGPADRAQCAPEPYSMRLRPYIPVLSSPVEISPFRRLDSPPISLRVFSAEKWRGWEFPF